MTTDIDDLLRAPSESAARADEVAAAWCSPTLYGHSVRSWVWARALGDTLGLAYDPELLYVASLLHDVGVAAPFDAHEVAFESAGGAVGWVFAAGAGWPLERRIRVQQVIERHMWVSVDPAVDVEGHLLERATSLDVAGAGTEDWDEELLRAVTARVPRGAFSAEFAAAIHGQARRKPGSSAARLDASGRIPGGAAVWDTVTRG